MCLACSKPDSWTINSVAAAKVAMELSNKADESNDARDHDELHAASVVVKTFANRGIIPDYYVERWIEGLR